jgi:hypothetical protein
VRRYRIEYSRGQEGTLGYKTEINIGKDREKEREKKNKQIWQIKIKHFVHLGPLT